MSFPKTGDLISPSPRPGTTLCSEIGMDQSMNPTSQSDLSSPIASDAADCTTSEGSVAGSFCSRAPTPQCLPLDDLIPENDATSQEAKYHYLALTQRLIADAQGRAPTPCSADPNTELDMTMLLDSHCMFDWSQAGTMTLDQLPDSDLWYRADYQLTQEWLDDTLKFMDEEKQNRVAGERESAEIDTEMG